jgi:hypothetical protein
MAVCLSRDNTKIFIPRFFPEQLEGGRSRALKVFQLERVPSRGRDLQSVFSRELIAMPIGIIDDSFVTDVDPDPVIGQRHDSVLSGRWELYHTVHMQADPPVVSTVKHLFLGFEFAI